MRPPSLQDGPTTVQSFCSRAQSRFSAFFHGSSLLTKERYRSPVIVSKGSESSRRHASIGQFEIGRGGTGSRSRTSIHSLIDPISSPNSGFASPRTEELWHHRGTFFRPVSALSPIPRLAPQVHNQTSSVNSHELERRPPPRARIRKHHTLSRVGNRQIKNKVIGSLISGTLLVLLLTICK